MQGDAIGAEQAAGAQRRIFVLLECALGSVIAGELHAHIPEDFNREVTVGSKDSLAVRLSSIIGDAGPVWEDPVRSDELPCADKWVRGWRLGMHGGNSEYHGRNERKDASGH
jgi:hypothetical protein